jgi:hypothetical protein
MDRTFSGDFHQARPLVFGHVSLDYDVAGDLADSAVPRSMVRTVLSMDPVVRQPYREGIDLKLLSLGIKAHRHRRRIAGFPVPLGLRPLMNRMVVEPLNADAEWISPVPPLAMPAANAEDEDDV